MMTMSMSLMACAPSEGGSSNGPPAAPQPPVGAVSPPEPPPEPSGTCNAAAVQDLRGRHLNDQLLALARERSGARDVRVIQPGEAVTMDYRPDRLNIEVMEDSRILSLRCG